MKVEGFMAAEMGGDYLNIVVVEDEDSIAVVVEGGVFMAAVVKGKDFMASAAP